jgi:hypothetical protein
MTLPTIEEARSWRGLTLVATGEPVGTIDAVYLDRTTRKPEWVLINTGLFGNARTFVPLANAAKVGETVRVPHDPGVVREAPRLALDSDLSESEEARLYSHYGIDYSTAASPSGLPAGAAGGGPAQVAAAAVAVAGRLGGRRGLAAGGRPVLGDHVGRLLQHHGLDRLGGLAVHAAQPPGQDLLGGQGAALQPLAGGQHAHEPQREQDRQGHRDQQVGEQHLIVR